MSDHFKQAEHGEVIDCDSANKKFHDLFKCLVDDKNRLALGLQDLALVGMLTRNGTKFVIPCRQCVRDMALCASDLAKALEALAEWKE